MESWYWLVLVGHLAAVLLVVVEVIWVKMFPFLVVFNKLRGLFLVAADFKQTVNLFSSATGLLVNLVFIILSLVDISRINLHNYRIGRQ